MTGLRGEQQWLGRTWRLLPMVLLVTGAVFVLPIVAVWELRSTGAVTSLWLLILVAVAISQGVSWLLRAYWTRSMHRADLLFSELLIWGWLWHLRSERRLASAASILRTLEQQHGLAPGILGDDAQAARWRVLRQLASALDAQDIYLHGHSRRVARHAEMIGRRMRLSSSELARLRAAAAAHDVGKLRVPRALLDKPGALTREEFAAVKRHADEGARLVSVLGDPEITSIVRHHHERIDGFGYPSQLAGDQIPLGARIVAVADTFDAITSERPYRPAAQHREAITTLKDCAGTQLDPDAVDAFLGSYAGRRQAFVIAALLAAPQQALARIVGGRTSSLASSAANGLAIVAVAAAVAAAASAPSAAAPFAIASRMAASVPVARWLRCESARASRSVFGRLIRVQRREVSSGERRKDLGERATAGRVLAVTAAVPVVAAVQRWRQRWRRGQRRGRGRWPWRWSWRWQGRRGAAAGWRRWWQPRGGGSPGNGGGGGGNPGGGRHVARWWRHSWRWRWGTGGGGGGTGAAGVVARRRRWHPRRRWRDPGGGGGTPAEAVGHGGGGGEARVVGEVLPAAALPEVAAVRPHLPPRLSVEATPPVPAPTAAMAIPWLSPRAPPARWRGGPRSTTTWRWIPAAR